MSCISRVMFYTVAFPIVASCMHKSPDAEFKVLNGIGVESDDPVAQSTVAIGSPLTGFFCSGTLLAKDLVVTAAHCIVPYIDKIQQAGLVVGMGSSVGGPEYTQYFATQVVYAKSYGTAGHTIAQEARARWGQLNPELQSRLFILWNLKKTTPLNTDQSKELSDLMSMQQAAVDDSQMNPSIPLNDIALVSLYRHTPPTPSSPAVLRQPTTTPALLAGPNDTLNVSNHTIVAGYGMTGPNSNVGKLYKLENQIKDVNTTALQVVTLNKNNTGGCHGDSGGPLYVQSGQTLKVFGVFSRLKSTPDCSSEQNTYTDLRGYGEWIACQAKYIRSEGKDCLDATNSGVFVTMKPKGTPTVQ